MDIKQIATSQEDILSETYTQWLIHPITRILLSNLNKHKIEFVEKLANNCNEPGVNEYTVRNFAYGVKVTDTIIRMISDFEVFKKLMNK